MQEAEDLYLVRRVSATGAVVVSAFFVLCRDIYGYESGQRWRALSVVWDTFTGGAYATIGCIQVKLDPVGSSMTPFAVFVA